MGIRIQQSTWWNGEQLDLGNDNINHSPPSSWVSLMLFKYDTLFLAIRSV